MPSSPPRSPSESDKAVGRAAAAAFGGTPAIRIYYDENESTSVDILSAPDRPARGLTSYSTIGLHNHLNLLEGADVRVEVGGIAPTSADRFPNVLATAAFCVMKDQWLCAPGVVFPSLIADYNLSKTLDHVLWVAPPFWRELGAVDLPTGDRVHWLMAVPISEKEYELLLDVGLDRFEALLEAHNVEYAALDRPSLR